MYYKYPRTPHLPWSPGLSDDDKVLGSLECFFGKEVVVTEKMDGENSSLYIDHTHARSIDSKMHPSRAWLRQMHANFKQEIPVGWRLCGENLYAKHSIHYSNLPSYFLVFGIYDDKNTCLSWDDTKEWCSLLGLHTVPELYRGQWDENVVKSLWKGNSAFGGEGEGYVVRVVDAFLYDDFWNHVAKYVRKGHVTTSSHWMQEAVVKNVLA